MSCKTIFDWLKHINEFKTDASQFSNADWDVFNAYMIHRFMSMHSNETIELANIAQRLHPTDKKGIYSFYKDFIPKNSKWVRYQKAKTKKYNDDLLVELADYYKISQREVKDYLNMLDKKQISRILSQRGIDNKQIKKLLK